jgi:hypothetical protein
MAVLLAALLPVCVVSAEAPNAADAARPFSGFAPRVTLPVLLKAHSVVADDMNEDGHLDLVVAVAGANSVAFFAGHGDGTFEPATYLPVGMTPKFAATGDFNRDGHRDIVVADQDDGTISVLLGNGDGTFRPKVTYASCHGAHEVAVADFNGDGKDDVAVACHGQPYSVSVFLGNGDGTFQPQSVLTPGAEPTALVVGDFNGDGKPDLAFALRAADAVAILLGNGDGTFQPPVTYPTGHSPHAVRAADLNGDGILDLVTADDYANAISILYGKGDGSFGPHVDMAVNNFPKSIALADLNGDGRPDIVVTNTTYPTCCTVEGSTISVFINEGGGRFAARRDFDAGGNPFSLLVRDLNGDGKADVATANFVDQTRAYHVYLEITHGLGLSGKPARIAGTALILVIGLLISLIVRRRSALTGMVVTLILAVILAGWFYKWSKPRLDGDSHITILFGQ